MPELSHQTVKLDRGRHGSPGPSMCVVELASVLAGDAFGDHPRSVCPVIAAFLRTYNDRIDDARRQDLLPYAARIVDSVVTPGLERERAELCVRWSGPAPRLSRSLRRLAAGRGGRYQMQREMAAVWAARRARLDSDEAHARALDLLDRLLAIGAPPREETDPRCAGEPAPVVCQPA